MRAAYQGRVSAIPFFHFYSQKEKEKPSRLLNSLQVRRREEDRRDRKRS